MASETQDVETYFGRCNCCLTYGYLRPMWDDNEENEVYGQILVSCFSIPWNVADDDKICEKCVIKLQGAYKFKQQVLESQKEIKAAVPAVTVEQIKAEEPEEEYVIEYLDEDILHKTETEVAPEMEYEADYLDDDDNEYGDTGDTGDPISYDEEETTRVVRKRLPRNSSKHEDSDPEAPKLKWPRKLPRGERWRTYKQYTDDDMKSALEAVLTKKMMQKDASAVYRVPVKTLCAKIREFKGKDDDEEIINKNESASIFAGELRSLLHYFNITPFRNRAGTTHCFHCKTRVEFEKPDELRQHTLNRHPCPENLVEMSLRPAWNNEIVKLDINNAKCKQCDVDLATWNDILEHLETHDITLEYRGRFIPFILGMNKCVLCPERFSSFSLLDTHMNKHFPNYVCGHCGDPFAGVGRMRAHEKTHSSEMYPCPMCDKVFSLNKYMKKHLTLKHMKIPKSKCSYCGDTFTSDYARQTHITKEHKEKINIITCELCGETFDWTRNYVRHMKRKHDTEFCCRICKKNFGTMEVLKRHKLIHKGDMFMCPLCEKKYSSANTLKSHVKFSHRSVPEKVKAVFEYL